jgi:hypothetical protein
VIIDLLDVVEEPEMKMSIQDFVASGKETPLTEITPLESWEKLTEDESPEPADEEEPVPAKKGFLKRTFFKNDLDYPTFLRAKAD